MEVAITDESDNPYCLPNIKVIFQNKLKRKIVD